MTPANAIAGFRKAGVCPFNRNEITVPTIAADKTATISQAKGTEANTMTSASLSTPLLTVTSATSPIHPLVLTKEQVAKFKLQHEEGYDLSDPEYLQCLN